MIWNAWEKREYLAKNRPYEPTSLFRSPPSADDPEFSELTCQYGPFSSKEPGFGTFHVLRCHLTPRKFPTEPGTALLAGVLGAIGCWLLQGR